MSLEVRVPSPKADVLKVLPTAERELVLAHSLRRSLARGAFLVRQGEQAETLFFVLTGRFDVLRGGRDLIAEIGEGEPIGEIAFFGGLERTADVVAARDADVLELSREGYEAIKTRVPVFTEAILRSFGQRLRAAAVFAPILKPRPAGTSALLGAGPRVPDPSLMRQIADRLARAGQVTAIGARDLPDEVATDGGSAFAGWLADLEAARGALLLVTGEGSEAFDRAVLAACDHLVLCGPLALAADGPVPLNAAEARAFGSFLPRKISLVLHREREAEPIRETRHWLSGRPVHLHHHLALDRDADFERLSRFVAGKAVGMVFGGGGALGAAHIGVMRALLEGGIVFDIFGGTSIGASIAAEFASGRDPSEFGPQFQAFFLKSRALSRLTVPLYSVFDHTHFDAELARRYAGAALEDYPLGAFAVSTSLTSGQSVVHREGPVWEAVRASASIPGALPPFVTDTGEVLVDGGLLDNVPLDVMRSLKAGPNVAVALSAGSLWTVAHPYAKLPNRRALVRELALRRHRAGDFPRITEVVARSMTVTSDRSQIAMDLAGDLLLEPPSVPGMTILDWARIPDQIEAGYRYTRARIERAGSAQALLTSARGS